MAPSAPLHVFSNISTQHKLIQSTYASCTTATSSVHATCGAQSHNIQAQVPAAMPTERSTPTTATALQGSSHSSQLAFAIDHNISTSTEGLHPSTSLSSHTFLFFHDARFPTQAHQHDQASTRSVPLQHHRCGLQMQAPITQEPCLSSTAGQGTYKD